MAENKITCLSSLASFFCFSYVALRLNKASSSATAFDKIFSKRVTDSSKFSDKPVRETLVEFEEVVTDKSHPSL